MRGDESVRLRADELGFGHRFDMGNDDSKKLILARRARFVAAALASVAASTTPLIVGAEACGGNTEEQSLGPPLRIDASSGKEAGPQPCLSTDAVAPEPEDAGRDGAADAGDGGAPADAADDGDAGPQPCLAPPPGP